MTADGALETVIPTPALVVLIGPSGAGKSTWAQSHFKPGQILSTDDFRALYGAGPDDQTAGTEAFALLDHLITARLGKGLTTVVDTTGLDPDRRAAYRAAAADAGLPCVAVGFDTHPTECHDRNRARPKPLAKSVVDRQLRQWRATAASLDDEGFDLVVVNPGPPRQVPTAMVAPTIVPSDAGAEAGPNDRDPTPLAVDLVVSSFEFGDADMATTLVDIARTAERVGFRALWVMDHFRQIPQVGRPWEPMLEAYTTLAYLAAATETIRLGTLVTNVEHRNVGLLAKIVATLDVLSGGRAECGLGAGWFAAERAAFGYPVNADRVRLDTLEDAVQALPILWGPGAKSFEGRVLSIPEAMAYPRPVQDPIPILVGGGGERRTLRIAARLAQACNVLGTDPETVAHKIDVARRHCADVGRDPETLVVTTLNPLLHAPSGRELHALIETLRPANQSSESFAAANHAGTTEEHVARFRQLSELGVDRVCVSLTANQGPARVEAFGSVIDQLD
jgi:F420-dependent oxidoreductase-like protein